MHPQRLIPQEVVLDINRQHLQPTQARLIKNLDYHGRDGSGALVSAPLSASALYDPSYQLPEGTNLKAGGRSSDRTGKNYVLVHNDQGRHTLYQMAAGRCETIFQGPELDLSDQPEHFVDPSRLYIDTLCLGEGQPLRTFVLFCNGEADHKFLCVEDAIATNSFDADQFPYFKGGYDRRELINLGMASPRGCLGITPVVDPDNQSINQLKKHGWRFRLCFIDVYGRKSEHGIISDLYYQSDCHSGNIHCLDLDFDSGGPLVDKIQVEYNQDGETAWHICKTLFKYEKCSGDWWTRSINARDFTFDPATNRITWRFCAGGECITVPEFETQRTENPLPRTSQSLFPINGGIGLAGNTYGFGPLPCEVLDNISFEVEKPAPDQGDLLKTRNITIWVPIFNAFEKGIQPVWTQNGTIVWGGVESSGVFGNNTQVDEGVGGRYNQTLPDDTQGFIGYLAGTHNAAISVQYQGIMENGRVTGWKKYGIAENANVAKGGSMWIQKFEFKNIPAGRYLFRLASHLSRLSDPGYQRTSTTTYGKCFLAPGASKLPAWNSDSIDHELLIDVCDQDYDSFTAGEFLQIWDLSHASGRDSRAVCGYVYEDRDPSGKGTLPIEQAFLTVAGANISRQSYRTDHNGFYFAAARDPNWFISMAVNRLCHFSNINHDPVRVQLPNGIMNYDFYAVDGWPSYGTEKCNRIVLQGRVVDCVSGAPVPGVVVGLTHSGFTSTDVNGHYALVVHDGHEPRREKLLFMGAGSCRLLNCDGGVCFTPLDWAQEACTPGLCADRLHEFTDYRVLVSGEGQRGLQLGGRYGFAVSGVDWMDRSGFAQVKNEWYLNIPTVNEMGSFRFPRIKWTIKSGTQFPRWMKELHFRVSGNLAYRDFHSWVVDYVDFIDNTGLENTIAPTQVRVHYTSLNEYNKQNNFSTNSTWQVVDQNNTLETKDLVHFVANGDGTIFPTVITQQVRHDKEGLFFLVDYTPELKTLSEGALIKFLRPGTCQAEEYFFELCKTVQIQNGNPTELTGYLNAFDAYYVSRQIPTPVVTTKKVTVPVPGSTSSTVQYQEVEESVTTNVIKPYSWLFEHHSPSDFWGDHLRNEGRPMVKNPLESVICQSDEIALSGVLGVNGLVNYLHYFDDGRKKTFKDQGWGPITAVLARGNLIYVLCQADWFLAPFDDNSIQVSGGRAIVKSADEQFGSTLNKQGDYGLIARDRSTLQLCGESIVWLDSRRSALVQIAHNIDQYGRSNHGATSLSDGRYYEYIKRKVRALPPGGWFVGQYESKTGQYLLTDFWPQGSYVNDRDYIAYDAAETIAVDMKSGTLRKFCSFTPEGYGDLKSDAADEQFFSFQGGLPWAHHRLDATQFNSFFGQPVPWVWAAVVGVDPLAVKEYLSLELYCKQVVAWASQVLTESGQVSRVPRNWFLRGERTWHAPFLCDVRSLVDRNLVRETTQNVLFEGDLLRGRWLECTLKADPDHLTDFFELTGAVINVNGIQTKEATDGQ